MAHKVLQQGYFWPTMKHDAFISCDKCQRFAPIPKATPENLTTVMSPWPFNKWGIDLIGPLHTFPRGYKFAIVAVDYYTKWTEAEPLASITKANCTNFIWKNILCRFGIPHSLVSYNGKQFENAKTIKLCEYLNIRKHFSTLGYPKSNGQVEAINKIIKHTLKTRLENLKGKRVDELPKVLWAYQTTQRSTTGETPFSLAYGAEAVAPVKVFMPTARITVYLEEENEELLKAEMDLLEERRIEFQLSLEAYQQQAIQYYNKKYIPVAFR